jgi:hypothetical protein
MDTESDFISILTNYMEYSNLLCGLVAADPEVPGSIPGTTTFAE